MPGIKKSVRLVENTIETCRIMSCATRNGYEDVNWSSSINAMAEGYSLIMAENKPDITNEQWMALYCLYNGYMPSDSAEDEVRLLPWHISEGYQYDAQVTDLLGTKESAISFIEQVKNWPFTTRLSAIYHAKKYWCPVVPF